VPLYEYECEKCGAMFEEIGKVGENQKPCPECGATANKIPSMFAMAHGKTRDHIRRQDRGNKYQEVCNNLKLKHDVHGFRPLPNSEGRDFDQVYKDVQKLGSKVKDEMAISRARNQALTKEKQKKWMEGAMKRTKVKTAALMEQRRQGKQSKSTR
jgi:putative FmdB family regulatory protein